MFYNFFAYSISLVVSLIVSVIYIYIVSKCTNKISGYGNAFELLRLSYSAPPGFLADGMMFANLHKEFERTRIQWPKICRFKNLYMAFCACLGICAFLYIHIHIISNGILIGSMMISLYTLFNCWNGNQFNI